MRVPDQELGWLIPATFKGIRLIREKKITHLMTTAPPFTSQLVGLAIKRFTGVRWVADFRDPWSLRDKYTPPGNRITDAMESRLIRSVMKFADVVLSVSSPMTEQLKKEHPDLDPDKFVTLTNGFDPSDFVGLQQSRPMSGHTLFSYIGEFAYGRTPEPFLRALKSLFDDGTLNRAEVRVKFVGTVAFAEGQSVTEMVRSLGLEEIVSMEPLVPRREALQRALESHVLLVLTERHPFVLTFKLFDALAAGATILNIGSKGAVADVLAKTGRGVAVEHTNVTEIRNGILECIRRRRSKETQRTLEPWADAKIQAYNFQILTGRLAEMLEGLEGVR
jgi:glycosyltransferase involved in cell wall biosynthesis